MSTDKIVHFFHRLSAVGVITAGIHLFTNLNDKVSETEGTITSLVDAGFNAWHVIAAVVFAALSAAKVTAEAESA